MPPRSKPLPLASTESARLARAAFLCELCQKQYTRQNELEAHESSYDHLHKKRLKEMKSLQGKMAVPQKKEVGEMRSLTGTGGREGVVSVKLGGGGGGDKKKGGFRNAFSGMEKRDEVGDGGGGEGGGNLKEAREEEVDSDVTDEDDYYDPRRPTGCLPGCSGREG